MSAAFAFAPQRPIPVIRPGKRRAKGELFQPEWEPIDDPYRDEQWSRGEPKRLRIPRGYHAALTGTALTMALTAVVSLGMTIRSVGLTLDAWAFWLAAWQFAALLAVPTRFVLAPLVTKVVGLLVEPE